MNIYHTCANMVMIGGILLCTGGTGQAQVSSGSPSGGGSTMEVGPATSGDQVGAQGDP